MKDLATKDKPTEPGWYLWWDEQDGEAPHHVLADVRANGGLLSVNFYKDLGSDNYSPLANVADRLWLKVGA